MNIVVHEDDTGWAPKECRFTAFDDDTYDGAEDSRRSTIGYGSTPAEAVKDWLEIALDECEITDAQYKSLLAELAELVKG